jgi:hypothetical protein
MLPEHCLEPETWHSSLQTNVHVLFMQKLGAGQSALEQQSPG